MAKNKKTLALTNDAPREILTVTALNKKLILNFGDSILEMNCDLATLSGTMKLHYDGVDYIVEGLFTELED